MKQVQFSTKLIYYPKKANPDLLQANQHTLPWHSDPEANAESNHTEQNSNLPFQLIEGTHTPKLLKVSRSKGSKVQTELMASTGRPTHHLPLLQALILSSPSDTDPRINFSTRKQSFVRSSERTSKLAIQAIVLSNSI